MRQGYMPNTVMPADHNRMKLPHGLARLIPYAGCFILTLILWLPFGFKDMGLIEEISITEQLDAGQSLFFISPQSALDLSRSRPLLMFFYAAAHALDPHSYQFYNLFMLAFFFGKLVVVYHLLLQFLPGQRLLAFVSSLLFMVYPGDTGVYALRTIHIHASIVAYLIAVYGLVRFRLSSGRRSTVALAGAAALLMFSLGQYQIALGAALFTPMLLFYFGRPYKRTLAGAGVWYGALAAVMLYAVWAGKQPGITAYEDGLLASLVLTPETVVSMANAVATGLMRQLTGWGTAWEQLTMLPVYAPYVAAALLVIICLGGWLMHNKPTPARSRIPRTVLLLPATGCVVFILGLSTFLPLPYYRFNTFRIYLLAMLGAALTLAGLLYLLSRLTRRYANVTFLILAMLFAGLGYLHALSQHQYYVNASLQQQSILQQIVSQAPRVQPGTAFVVLDQGKRLDPVYVFYKGSLLANALRYLYQDVTLDAGHCPFYDGSAASPNCQFEPSALKIVRLNDEISLPYARILFFTSDRSGQLTLLSAAAAQRLYGVSDYQPASRIVSGTPPDRIHTLFSCQPALDCYQPLAPIPVISDHFELPQRDDIGFGWRELEFDQQGASFHWSVNSSPTIDVLLSDSSDLRLEFRIENWVDTEQINSLRLLVNGQDIPLRLTSTPSGGRLYEGVVPRGINGGQLITQLVFSSQRVPPVPQLGFALYSMRIEPLR